MDFFDRMAQAYDRFCVIVNDPELLYENLVQFSGYPCSIMLLAFVLESFIPIPKFLRLSSMHQNIVSLGYKVNKSENTGQQNFLSGLFLSILTIVIALFLLEILKLISGNDVIIIVLVLMLLLEMGKYQKLSQLFFRVINKQDNNFKDKARKLIAPELLRECDTLSLMGMSKALSESVAINTANRFYAILFWYSILNLEGALFVYLVTVLTKAFNIKQKSYIPFGLSIYRINQAIFFLPNLTIALILAILSLHPFYFLNKVLHQIFKYPNLTTAILLSSLGLSLNLKFSGPRFYNGEKVRFENIGGDEDPTIDSPLLCMRKIRICGVIFIALNFIFYFYNYHVIY